MLHLNRRRFLTVSAALLASGNVPAASAAATASRRWQGIALGAHASLTFQHPDPAEAGRLIAGCRNEIDRLEAIFSLYRRESLLSRLNAAGRLDDPPADLLRLLSTAETINRRTGGRFDPTVQPLWALHAHCLSERPPRLPGDAELAAARDTCGWRHLRYDADEIAFDRPGMALTLNGIAQGYIADRVSDWLRAQGLGNVLVETGEVRALGSRPDGTPWRVGLRAADGSERTDGKVDLRDGALAVSAPLGTRLDGAGRVGHIIDPSSGHPGGTWSRVVVRAPSAAEADGYSTAFCLMERDAIEAARPPHIDVMLT
ncbi:FAD:protein FMN transferase [Oceanibacterium hippocampi]|uniref:FAD:protein FMN transferase n=1 Tax=Oceanibacterium hippocampi TaxID=745714 RepID=A0A1Y5TD81_9PROT|nr:FAD:protein FMN transferase [Oceanibacterium hippocampi]SLN61055.1 Thiamine biosynthesis lipoprotein ApbE precursor [Oceanibacterium hippocampi]